ncbi:hypothetical protein OKW21_004954 [Catalinimonas alkaloidigena]|uniref:O-antigen polymerase n=1 Tax=Catalinimonas alkaloidigena TaxID=1075417 RepID=UPI0024060219|nr:O-antigen polymerase [Catalinimonas alkaloidigena]MDF9799691.1 hypothetical protein [Catalinimonas alkaloidigena]
MALTLNHPAIGVPSLEEEQNPYVSISYEYLVLIFLYFVLYEALVPLLKLLFVETLVPYSYTRYTLNLLYKTLLFAPIFFFRREVGFLHPLVFIVLLSVAQSIMEGPEQLISFLILEPMYGKVEVTSGPLTVYNQAELSFLEIKLVLLNILSLVGIYAGYFTSIKLKTFNLPYWRPKRLKSVTIPIILLSLAWLVLYVQSRGGITAHFSTFGLGRENAVGEDGVIHVLINFGYLATLIWFAFDDKAYKNPIFWLALATTIPTQFILRGSRSSIVFAALLFLLIYIIKNRNIPTVRILIVAFIAVNALGVLGALRKSTFGSNQVNWEILTDFSFSTALDLYIKDTEHRDTQQPDLTALEKGIQSEGMLWGKTYLGGLFFFVPRVVWENKPHSIGYYTGTLLYGSAGGKPPGDVVEAYWNFHIVGVFFVFFLYGCVLRWLAKMLLANQGNLAFNVIFIIILFYFRPSNLGMIKCFQQLMPVLLLLWLIGAIPPRINLNHLRKIT